jgi:hypothetical protein
MSKISVKGTEITVIRENDKDYISLTDMLKAKEGQFFIDSWLRNRNTIEFLGIWERLNNPDFNYVEFDVIKSVAGLNTFKISVKEWVIKTKAIGMMAKTGRYGGTYAHKDIAFEFGTWISPEFKLYLISEFQRLKEQEQKLLNPEWDYRRFLSKVNYRIHTDAIKENIIPKYTHITKEQEGYIYAHEAEMLNVAIFGITSKQWRENNPHEVLKGNNIRDFANIPQLTVLSNLENLHAHLIKQGNSPQERFEKLKAEATSQLKSLMNYKYTYPIESPRKYEQNSTFDNHLKGLLSVPPETRADNDVDGSPDV